MFRSSPWPFFMMDEKPKKKSKGRGSSMEDFFKFAMAWEEFKNKDKKDDKPKEEKKEEKPKVTFMQGVILLSCLQMAVGPMYIVFVFAAIRYILETVSLIQKVPVPH